MMHLPQRISPSLNVKMIPIFIEYGLLVKTPISHSVMTNLRMHQSDFASASPAGELHV